MDGFLLALFTRILWESSTRLYVERDKRLYLLPKDGLHEPLPRPGDHDVTISMDQWAAEEMGLL